MSLSEDVDLEEFVMAKDDMSGADIKAVCTEAGLLALRERRMRVTKADFTTAREKVCLVLHGSIWISYSFRIL
jgi:26S proteasome regulatory subunit T2